MSVDEEPGVIDVGEAERESVGAGVGGGGGGVPLFMARHKSRTSLLHRY